MALANAFDAVQSAYIGAETNKKDAQAYAETVVPQAQAQANAAVQAALGAADADMAMARGDAAAFAALDREYRANPVVVRRAAVPRCRRQGARGGRFAPLGTSALRRPV